MKGIKPTINNQPHRVIVKQTYAIKCDEKKIKNFKSVNLKIINESSRIMRSDGKVIKIMNDGGVEIYQANGIIYRKEIDLIANKLNETAQIENIEMEIGLAAKFKTSKLMNLTKNPKRNLL